MYNILSDSDEFFDSFLHFEGDTLIRSNTFQNQEANQPNIISLSNTFRENENNVPTYDFSNEGNIVEPVSMANDTSDSSNNKLKKKRGRKNNKPEIQHDKKRNDNRMAKIQRSYLSFLIVFLNYIMKKLKIKYGFVHFDGKWKGNVNQKFRYSLTKKTIKDIIYEAPISLKFEKDEEYNKNTYQKLKDEGYNILLDIMDKNYLYFFEKIYYNNLRKFNLSSFGLNSLDVDLPNNIKLFNDLLNKSETEDFDDYKTKMEKCVIKYFINFNKSSSFADEIFD